MSVNRVSRPRKATTGIAALCVLAVHLIAAPAPAQEVRRVLVVPLSGSGADALADLPAQLTGVLLRTLDVRGADVTRGQTSLDDTLAIVGCTSRSATCLEQAATALEVDEIVFGAIQPGETPDTLIVSITVAIRGEEPVRRTIVVPATSTEDAVQVLAEEAPGLFGRRAVRRTGSETDGDTDVDGETGIGSETEAATRADPRGQRERRSRRGRNGRAAAGSEPADGTQTEAGEDTAALLPDGEEIGQEAGQDAGQPGENVGWLSGFAFDRVQRTSWAITGAGGGLMGTGMVFWMLARQRQGQVDEAPASTAAELEQLVGLEDGVRDRALIGNTLFLAGAVTAGIGLTFAIREARSPAAEAAPVIVVPVASRDSVGLVLGMRWPQ